MAARFHLFTGNYYEARQIARRIIAEGSRNNSGNTSTVFEMEAYLIENWCTVEEVSASWTSSTDQKKQLCNIENTYQTNGRSVDMQDLDSLMCLAKTKYTKGLVNEALAVLNQVRLAVFFTIHITNITTFSFYLHNHRIGYCHQRLLFACASRQGPHSK